mgnify:CR=1 FL=1
MLDYDDSAFFYFSLAILSFILVPYWYFAFKAAYVSKFSFDNQGVNCETKWFQDLMKEKKKQSKKSNLNLSLMFRFFVGAFFSYIWLLNYQHVNSIDGLQSFDPYAILDIDMDADERSIKKQYRRLSLQLHPDKNPDDPLAVQNFIKLTKAYNVSLPTTS